MHTPVTKYSNRTYISWQIEHSSLLQDCSLRSYCTIQGQFLSCLLSPVKVRSLKIKICYQKFKFLFVFFSIESQYRYFYMDVIQDRNLIPWRSIAANEVPLLYVCVHANIHTQQLFLTCSKHCCVCIQKYSTRVC